MLNQDRYEFGGGARGAELTITYIHHLLRNGITIQVLAYFTSFFNLVRERGGMPSKFDQADWNALQTQPAKLYYDEVVYIGVSRIHPTLALTK